ncbi:MULTISPECIES: DUF2316 family protein [Listeria]|uniref:DUF2316 domain-containing protein n=2 Tax=Listeria TaxID=1637 RepID=A0A5D5PSV5_LISMN|nr:MULTISPECIES: DUF2316 family protein [Listeria]EAF4457042.1 DUF2316 family protein [Listeria monocytogenes serotype 1/2a]EFD91038.1 conserved hypothetical protein [Listeria monocytogenes FSL J2-071]EFR88344.1 conserved hypothetical protein [Listeria marthii FSL S4-120]ALQ15975.1 hypothetical protein ATE43_03150 [Listeria monocytogenes]ALQ20177.1 hypothetical protein ATE44_11240 [Listeria monocytogenes]
MTLSKEQMKATKSEFAENLALANLTIAEVAKELNTSEVKIERILNLKQRSLNDGWILRNYLLRKVAEVGKTPVPFTALSGDYHGYWFLDGEEIDSGILSIGNH